MKLNVGVIGAGIISRIRAEEYQKHPRVRIYAVAETNADQRRHFARDFQVEKTFSDYRELLRDDRVDLVDIGLPHFLHRDATVEALNAGKQVLLEKPIAMTLEEADEMIELAQKRNGTFLVSLNQRLLPAHQKLKELLQAGRIGKPFLAMGSILCDELWRMQHKDHWKGSWDRAGGGALIDTGTHVVDLMQYLFGIPRAVTCSFGRYVVAHENKGDDNVVLTLEYDDMLATVTISYAVTSDRSRQKTEVYGTRASVHVLCETDRPIYTMAGKGKAEYLEVEHDPDWTYSVRLAVPHYVDCILDGCQPVARPEDARAALQTILLAYEAARTGKRIGIPREY